MLLKYFSKWEEAESSTYRLNYTLFGGNASSNPDLLDFQHEVYNIPHRYMVKVNSKGSVIAAVCVWKDKFLANDCLTSDFTKHKALPVPKDELLLPVDKSAKFLLPFNSKILSSLHAENVINVSFKMNSGRAICIAKPVSEFTPKTRQTRQREVNKFISHGGEIKNISEFSTSDAMDIYDELFYMRRGVHTKDLDLNKYLLKECRDKLFGFILMHDNTPCAMQLILKTETQCVIFFDYINIGYNIHYNSLCLGTVLTWLNLKAATELCNEKNKGMRYSFGKPTFSYKDRWCNQEPLGRVIAL